MDAVVNVLVGEVLIRHRHENGDCQSERSRVLVPTIHTLRGTGMFPSDSTSHLKKKKSGYVPTNTCPLFKGKGQVKLDPQNLQQHAAVTEDDLTGTPKRVMMSP